MFNQMEFGSKPFLHQWKRHKVYKYASSPETDDKQHTIFKSRNGYFLEPTSYNQPS